MENRIKLIKRILYYTWLAVVVAGLGFFLLQPERCTPDALAEFLKTYHKQALAVYIAVSLLRGLFLIPSTPFVLGGAMLFPEMPWVVLTISMAGVLAGASMVYFFSDLLGFSKRLDRAYPKQMALWHRRLNSPKALLFVVAWSFFPFVPTDLICYVGGIVKMPYRWLVAGVFLGELTLNVFYVFLGVGIVDWLMG